MRKNPPKEMTKPKSWRNQSQIAVGFDRIIFFEFDLLEEHRAFVQKYFSASLTKLETRFEKEMLSIVDPDDQAAYQDNLVDEYQRLSGDLPRIQWNAQFLVAYSTFENSLNALCRIVERRSGARLSFKDISGRGIVRAANYLSKVGNVKEPFETRDWQKALLYGEIRNAIAHQSGEIEYELTNKGSLAFRIQKVAGLELKQAFEGANDATIYLGPEFLSDAIRTLRKTIVDIANYELYQDER